MQVKELELSGFKSFVDRVKLNFKPGITALVGPNGCGKSNIIDAIRWIMGEHNARHLRGTKMEDLIFNGSETRKPNGMAEVSLVLKSRNGNGNGNGNGGNGNGGNGKTLLSNVSEIMVTRRLFRSGESEYYINKIPCRLKDVVEVFLDSGVGTKSYSIMEQGKVDFILGLKPDERRLLIEEAAGISKYRTRKKEALSKMDSTKTNLSRLKDILNELQIQMRGLDLQVKRLKRHRNIKEEIKQIDLMLASKRLHTLTDGQAAYQTELSNFRDEEINLTTQINSIEAVLEENKLQLTELQKNLSQLQQDYYHGKETIQKEENSIQLSRNELQNADDQINKINHSIDMLDQERKSIDIELAAKQLDMQTVHSSIEMLENNFKDSAETLSSSKERLKDLQAKIEKGNAELRTIVYDKTEAKNAILMNKRLQEELVSKHQKLTAEKEICENNTQELDSRRTILEKQVHELIQFREHKEKEIDVFKERINYLSDALHEKESILHNLKEHYGTVKARYLSLQDLHKNLEGFNDGVRTLMSAVADNTIDIKGILCLLADIIETESTYEHAVEAVLDRKLQSILIETHIDGLHALEYLKNHNCDRVSFIPLTLTGAQTSAVIDSHAIPLDSLIKVKQEYKGIIEHLVHNVFLVPDIEKANELWNLCDKKYTFVTLQGEIIEPQGIITGGNISGSGTGILKRNREIREFSEELQTLESQIIILRDEKEHLDNDLIHARQACELLIAEKQGLDIRIIQEKSQEEQTVRELFQENKKIEIIASEEEETTLSLQKYQHELEQFIIEEKHFEGLEEDKIHVLKAIQNDEEYLRNELSIFETSATELRIKLATTQKEYESTQSTFNRLSDLKQTTETKIEDFLRERSNLENKIKTLTDTIASSQKLLQELLDVNRALEAQIETAQQTLQALGTSVTSHEDTLKQLRHRKDEIDPKIFDIEKELSNTSIHLEHLLKEIHDKYGSTVEQFPLPEDQEPINDDEALQRLEQLNKRLENIGDVNLGASREYEELEKRYQYLGTQEQDLLQAIDSLQKVIAKINRITRQKFLDTFTTINNHFIQLFPILFNGGKAYMQLTDENDLLETGIEIFAQPPGKKLQSLDLLSGGERALTVIAILFSIFLTKPTPFCLMDEIDAPLDDTNIGRFITHLQKMAEHSQFLIVTHNKLSMQAANSLYGVTMEERGVSKVVSVELN